MRRLLGISISFFFLAIFILAITRDFMQKLQENRYYGRSMFVSDRYRHGDLYGFSYLPQFRNLPKDSVYVKPQQASLPKCINLVALCDSYIWSFALDVKAWDGVEDVTFVKWNAADIKETVTIDTARLNVLLIEKTERELRSIVDTAYVFERLKITYPRKEVMREEPDASPKQVEKVNYSLVGTIFNPDIEQNLDFLLFDYSFWTPFKEWKALLNYRWFDRTQPKVNVSKSKDFLYYHSTTDSTMINSSFHPVTDRSVDSLVKSINTLCAHYKKRGFDEVIFSFIPNPVTIVEPQYGTYNRLIPRIQSHPALQVPFIDSYTPFSQSQIPLYQPSDTHWNSNGFQLWMNAFNRKLNFWWDSNRRIVQRKCMKKPTD